MMKTIKTMIIPLLLLFLVANLTSLSVSHNLMNALQDTSPSQNPVLPSYLPQEKGDDDLVFIHHSCGANWLSNSLHNALLAKDYIDERNDIYYGTDIQPTQNRPDSLAPTPGDKTNMNHWILWFNDYLPGLKTHGCEDGINRIIMFKSCYPISNIYSNGTDPGDPFSPTQTITNYKAVYRHPNGSGNIYMHNGYSYKPLEDIFSENPNTLFIPVTAPPRHYAPVDATTNEEAHRARLFNNWLKYDWLTTYRLHNLGTNNVAVFDWFHLLAYPDNHSLHPNRLKAEYGGESGNSHPNSLANSDSTQIFATNPTNFIDETWNTFQQNLSVYTYHYNRGWNLFTLPLESFLTAESLGQNISGCTLVVMFNASNQTFHTHVVGTPWDNFLIKDGIGYCAYVQDNCTFEITGVPIVNTTITLCQNWNLIGWYSPINSTAETLGTGIDGCTMVVMFDTDTQSFITHVVGIPWDDFPITQGMGLFIYLS